MKRLKIIFIFFALCASINANAQFGSLLKGLVDEAQKAAQNTIATKDSPISLPSFSSSADKENLMSSYCTNVSNSEMAKEIAKRISYAKNNLGGRAEFPQSGTDFDKALKNWLYGNFNKYGLKNKDDYKLMASTVNSCFSELMTKNWLYLISQGSQFDTLDGLYNPQTSGIKKGDDVIWRDQRSTNINWEPSGAREEFLYGFFFPDYDAFLKSTNPKLLSDFDNRTAISIDNYKKGKAQDEARAIENKKYKDEVAAQKSYLNSPDGQLIYTYERFQIVDLCHSGRKEYAVKYVTDGEFSDLKSKVKSIENKLKGSLVEKNTDKLWAKAEANNRNFMGTGLDAIEVFKNKGGDRILCNNAAIEINDVANNVLGKESLKKGF